jgi:hypothetical protein
MPEMGDAPHCSARFSTRRSELADVVQVQGASQTEGGIQGYQVARELREFLGRIWNGQHDVFPN